MIDFARGDIYYIEPYLTEGSEQRAGRPAIIVSNDLANRHSSVVEVVYLTTQPKTDLPTHVTIRSTNRESTALCEQITSVSKDRIGSFLCSVTRDEIRRLNLALLTSLDLSPATIDTPPPPRTNRKLFPKSFRPNGIFIKGSTRAYLPKY